MYICFPLQLHLVSIYRHQLDFSCLEYLDGEVKLLRDQRRSAGSVSMLACSVTTGNHIIEFDITSRGHVLKIKPVCLHVRLFLSCLFMTVFFANSQPYFKNFDEVRMRFAAFQLSGMKTISSNSDSNLILDYWWWFHITQWKHLTCQKYSIFSSYQNTQFP